MEEGEPEIPMPQEAHVPGPLELVPVCESHSGDDIETDKVITRDGKVFGVNFVTPGNLTNDLPQDDAYNIMDRRLFKVTEFMDECCYDRSCVNNFEGLPDRLLSAPFEYLYYDIDGRPGYCKEKNCGFPLRRSDAMAYQLYRVCGAAENYLCNELGWNCIGVENHIMKLFYMFAERIQRRINKTPCRRNVLNIAIVYPYHNSYKSYHQTYRYIPKRVGTDLLLRRILSEAMGALRHQLEDQNFQGFHCKGH